MDITETLGELNFEVDQMTIEWTTRNMFFFSSDHVSKRFQVGPYRCRFRAIPGEKMWDWFQTKSDKNSEMCICFDDSASSLQPWFSFNITTCVADDDGCWVAVQRSVLEAGSTTKVIWSASEESVKGEVSDKFFEKHLWRFKFVIKLQQNRDGELALVSPTVSK